MSAQAASLRSRGTAADAAALAAVAVAAVLAALSLKYALAFVGVVAVVYAMVHFARPAMLVPALIFSVYFGALHFGPLTIARVVGPVALMAAIIGAYRHNDLGLRGSPIHRWIAVYGTVAVASLYWSNEPGASASLIISLVLAVCYTAAITTLTRTREDLHTAMEAIPLIALALSAAGLGIFLVRQSAIAAEPIIGDRNFFAAFLAVAMGPAGILVFRPRARWHRPAGLLALAFIVTGIVASGSQGGMLSMLGVIVLAAIIAPPAHIRRRTLPLMVFAAPLMIALFVLILSSGGQNTSGAADTRTAILKSSVDRVNLWRGALHAYADKPVTGIGYGAYAPRSSEYMLDTPGVDLIRFNLPDHAQEAHNSYIEALAELGPVGLLAFVGMILATALTLIRLMRWGRSHDDPQIADTAVALLLSVFAFAIASFFLSVPTTRCWWMIFGLTIAAAHMVWKSGFGHGEEPAVHTP